MNFFTRLSIRAAEKSADLKKSALFRLHILFFRAHAMQAYAQNIPLGFGSLIITERRKEIAFSSPSLLVI